MGIKNRDVIKSIILSVVTCGIYGIYWTYCMVKEAVATNDSSDNGRLEILLAVLLPFIGYYLTEKKFAKGCEANGIEHTDRSVIYLILCLIPCAWFITVAMFQSEFNKIKSIIE